MCPGLKSRTVFALSCQLGTQDRSALTILVIMTITVVAMLSVRTVVSISTIVVVNACITVTELPS